MRGGRSILIAAAAAVALVGGLAAPAFAATIDVYPGQSIQAAVDSAGPGDTIVVHAGVYAESVVIRTPRLTLLGAGNTRRGTVLVPPASADNLCADSAQVFNGFCVAGDFDPNTGEPGAPIDGTTIQGFLIQGFAASGIIAFNSSNSTFTGDSALDNDEYGIASFVGENVTVRNSIVDGAAEAGIYIGDSPQSNADVRDNRVTGASFGIMLRDSANAHAVGNRLTGNCVGLIVLDTNEPGDSRDHVVAGNWASSNNKVCEGGEDGPPISGVGIALVGAKHTDVENNSAYDNVPAGPTIASGGIAIFSSRPFGGSNPVGNLIAFNAARGNAPYDISWDRSGKNTFHHNDCGSSSPGWICP